MYLDEENNSSDESDTDEPSNMASSTIVDADNDTAVDSEGAAEADDDEPLPLAQGLFLVYLLLFRFTLLFDVDE